MKFPSISYLQTQAWQALRRFPLTIVSAIVAAIAGVVLVESENSESNLFPWINLLLCGYLGVPLFIGSRVFAENRQLGPSGTMLLKTTVLALLVGVYFYLPGSEDTLNKLVPYVRYTVFAISAHLLVSFVPFIGRKQLNGFWQYNKAFFLRFLLSALYSSFFYIGIAMAMGALNLLFDADIDEKLFFEVFIVIAAVFNTWFFVAGLPEKADSLEGDKNYPNGLRVFIVYVLVPLLALYLVILYSYSAKVVLSWDWPEGIIAYMILAVAILGILAMLLSWPFTEGESSGPLKFLSRSYYLLLLPLTIMLFLAIGLRTSEYGITANRYITWLMGIWLVLICCYFVFRGKDLRAVPISLFLFTLLSSFGPWGMFSVSERSQINRLEEILTKNGILVNGKITNEPVWDSSDPTNTLFLVENGKLNEGKISHSDHNEVESILNYLQDFHGITGIDEWYAQNPMEIAAQTKAGEANVYMQLMGLNYIHYYDDEGYRYVSFYNNNNTPIRNVSGFDYSMTLNHYQGSGLNENTVSTPKGTLVLSTTDSLIAITLQQGEAHDQHSIQINGLFETLQKKYPGESGGSVSSEEMTVVYENQWMRMRLTLNSVTGEVKESDSEMTGYDGELLVGLKERP